MPELQSILRGGLRSNSDPTLTNSGAAFPTSAKSASPEIHQVALGNRNKIFPVSFGFYSSHAEWKNSLRHSLILKKLISPAPTNK